MTETDMECQTVFWNLELYMLQRRASAPLRGDPTDGQDARCSPLPPSQSGHMEKILPPEAALRRRLSLFSPQHLHLLAPPSSYNTALTSPLLSLGRHPPSPSRAPLHPYTPPKGLLPSICLGVLHSGTFAHVVLPILNALPHSRS